MLLCLIQATRRTDRGAPSCAAPVPPTLPSPLWHAPAPATLHGKQKVLGKHLRDESPDCQRLRTHIPLQMPAQEIQDCKSCITHVHRQTFLFYRNQVTLRKENNKLPLYSHQKHQFSRRGQLFQQEEGVLCYF